MGPADLPVPARSQGKKEDLDMAREKGVDKINRLGGEGGEVRDGDDRPCIRAFGGNVVLGVGSV